MKDVTARLGSGGGISDDMHNRNEFTESAANTTEGAQLARPECGDEGACTLDAGVAIGCICANQLIGGASPSKVALRLDEV